MKKSKINLLLMAALVVIQAPAHAKDKVEKPENTQPTPRTWSQAAWDNRYGIAAGTAAVGVGALGYAFRNELIDVFNSMSPAKQEEMKAEVEKSLEQTEQVIEAKQEEIKKELAQVQAMNTSGKHSTAQNKQVAQKEESIAEKQELVTQLEKQVIKKAGFLGWVTGQNSYQEYRNQVSQDIDEQSALDAARNARREAESLAENSDYRSSHFEPTDEERAAQAKSTQHTIDLLNLRGNDPFLLKDLDETNPFLLKNEFDQKYRELNKQGTQLREKHKKEEEKNSNKYRTTIRNLENQKKHYKITPEEYQAKQNDAKKEHDAKSHERREIERDFYEKNNNAQKALEQEYINSIRQSQKPSDKKLTEMIDTYKKEHNNYMPDLLVRRNRTNSLVRNNQNDIDYMEDPIEKHFAQEAQDNYKSQEQKINDEYNAEPARTSGYVSDFLSDWNPLSASRNSEQSQGAKELETIHE